MQLLRAIETNRLAYPEVISNDVLYYVTELYNESQPWQGYIDAIKGV